VEALPEARAAVAQEPQLVRRLDALDDRRHAEGVDEPEREEGDNGKERPDWRQYCIEQYTDCQTYKWTGNCSDCLHRCTGQRGKWPSDMCRASQPGRRK